MTTAISCPDQVRLRQLLDDALPADEQPALQDHLEGCKSCQQILENLAAGAKSWEHVATLLTREQAASMKEPGLEHAVAELVGKAFDDGEEHEQDDDLNYLEPPHTAGNLGRLGHYEILEVIGRGGFGVVLRAFDEKLHRIVAIKVLSQKLTVSGSARKRFVREAQAAAAIAHEHVVTIHAVEKDHDPPYFVMHCIDGMTLQQKIDSQGALEVKEILRIGVQAAEGMAAAHKHGLVHRDIKPANILLENGVERVKITDFGLARAVDDASLTQSGVVAGTPMYMAPEQAAGDHVDPRADLFSLGSVLYAMCTGRPPFRASRTMAVLMRVVTEEARPIHELNPMIPEGLVEIIARLHAKKPEDRWQSAQEVADRLSEMLAHVQATGRAESYIATAARNPAMNLKEANHAVGRPKSVAWKRLAVVAVCVGIVALVGVGFYFLSRADGVHPGGDSDVRPPNGLPAVDLMPLARPNPKAGTWKREGDTLVSVPRTANDKMKFRSALPIPVELPREFIIEAIVERLTGDDVFTLNIPAFDTDFMVSVDGFPWKGFYSGLSYVDGKLYSDNETAVRGQKLVNGRKHTIRATVRAAGIAAEVDGKVLFDYRGGYAKLEPKRRSYGGAAFFVEIVDSPYRIHALRLLSLDGGEGAHQ